MTDNISADNNDRLFDIEMVSDSSNHTDGNEENASVSSVSDFAQ